MTDALRKLTWVVAWLIALGAATAGLAGATDVALALLALAVLATGGAAFLSFRALADVVRQAAAPSRRLAASVAARAEPQGLEAAEVEAIVQRRIQPVHAGIAGLVRQIDHQPYVHTELHRRYAQLIGATDEPMPVLGANWAATAPTILFLVDEILGRDARRTLVECGSGASTLWTAAALRHRGNGGHVWSLESDAAYAEVTRENLKRHGLEAWATVIDAPLVETPVAELGTVQPWYDLSGWPDDVVGADLLFVDGPPGVTAKMARFPAVPQLMPSLRDGALVVLDDTNRPHERAVVRHWRDLHVDGRRLRVVKTVGRSTVLEVGSRQDDGGSPAP
ncbi:class I SAM-dependent methyltransferase [Isoptericola sp. S6320L]|uniref:class I SAM-dependent methyltransferase n=1 Tax=Isoptericola sp. S6320L TaxID=2926411 RepID=UPI001FF1142E|nr:class I SAM-dependent methyltransferase [Isoptericola sp. S6320L]MCK0118287.1 class I SAM-dependent methyltransferase [Isoptericola sp. S6320L]